MSGMSQPAGGGVEGRAMHSFTFRANAVLTFGITVLSGLCILASLTDSFYFAQPDVNLKVLNVDVLQRLANGKDELMRPLPALREVHLWCVFPEEVDAVLLKSYEKILSPEELDEVPNARTEKMQRGRLLARTLVRSTLARYTNGVVEPASLMFQKNQFGKPEVVWPTLTTNGKPWKPPPLSFNLSHTTSLVACGVALDSAIGVDVEAKERPLSTCPVTFARRRFSHPEAEWLQHISDVTERRRRFMQLWTLKESYVKAVGKGISGVPFRDFTFRLTNTSEARELLSKVLEFPSDSQAELISLELAKSVAEREKAASCWNFVLFEPSPAHVAALCIEDKLGGSDEGAVPFRVKVWKTVPFKSDESLHNGAVGLAVSHGCQLRIV